MCIAILNTKGVTLKKELLSNCWINNGDGAGILVSNGKSMEVFKEMKSFDTFYNQYLAMRKKYKKSNIVLHFRISTHGKINETNCHPFLVSDEVGFVHNGMIYNAPVSEDFSDTYMFNEVILKKLKEGFERDEHMIDLLSEYIGTGSKLIFLNAKDEWSIVNEKAGHWDLGCWFSNTSYKQVNNYVDYGGIKKYRGGSYGYLYGSYGGWSYNHDSFYDDEDVNLTPEKKTEVPSTHCKGCECKLYGINELDRGYCDWCVETDENPAEIKEDDDYDVCEYCEGQHGHYHTGYRAYLCQDCEMDLEGEETTPSMVDATEKTFRYDKETNKLYCYTNLGTFAYDQNRKTYVFVSDEKGA